MRGVKKFSVTEHSAMIEEDLRTIEYKHETHPPAADKYFERQICDIRGKLISTERVFITTPQNFFCKSHVAVFGTKHIDILLPRLAPV